MPVAGAIIGGVGSLAGGKMQSDAAGNATNAQTQAGRDAINAQLAIYNQNRQDSLPYQTTGVGALNLLAQMYGLPTSSGGANSGGITVTGGEPNNSKKSRSLFDKLTDPANLADQFGGTSYDPMGFFSGGKSGGTTPMQFNVAGAGSGGVTTPGTGKADFSQFYESPDFIVARDNGLRGLQNSANDWNPGGFGGRLDMDRMKFASDLGSQAFSGFQNNLFRLAGFGGQANSQLGNNGSNFANQVSNQYQNIGNANASGYLNQANAWGNALQGVGTSIGRAWPNANSSGVGPVQREQIPLQGW